MRKHEDSLQKIELLDSKQLDDYSYLLELATWQPLHDEVRPKSEQIFPDEYA